MSIVKLKARSHIEEQFALHVRASKLPEPKREFRFCEERQFRADFAWPERKLLVELEGGLYMTKGGHNTPHAIERDMLKSNIAQALGYQLFRFSGRMVQSGQAIEFITYLFQDQKWA
jgi:very-short-patch-repair endonuclease